MRKTAVIMVLITLALWLHAEEKVLLRLRNASRVEAEFIQSDDEGNLTVEISGHRYIVPRRDYKIAIMSLPPVLQNAKQLIDDSRYGEARAWFDKHLQYWDFPVLRCRARLLKARAEMGEGDYQAAIKTLLPLLDDSITDQFEEGADYAEARLALALARRESGEPEKSREILREVMMTGPPAQAAEAGNKLAEHEFSLDNLDQAVLLFLRAVLYYEVSVPGRRHALERLVEVLGEMDDPRQEIYADMLKQQYAMSEPVPREAARESIAKSTEAESRLNDDDGEENGRRVEEAPAAGRFRRHSRRTQ